MGNSLGNKDVMASNIQYYLDLHDKDRNDLCRDLGFKYTTVSNWLQGEKYPRIDKIEMMARYFGITKSDLVEPRSDSRRSNGIRIPVLGRVAAGIPIDAVEDILGYEEISEQMARCGTYFALRIQGQSMEPTLHDGDTVIVRQQENVENGEIAIVLVDNGEATVKEIKESPEGITLIGHNVAVYSPHFYSNSEITSLPVKIIGKVVELRRAF